MTSTKRLLSRLLLLLLTLCGAARAQSNISCDEHPDCSKQLAAAQKKVTAGEPESALRSIQSLLDQYQDPRLLFSIARILHRLNRFAEAIPVYRRFLESGAEHDPQILAKARQRLAEAEASAPPPVPPTSDAVPPSPPPAATTEPKLEHQQSSGERTPTESSSATARPLYKRPWFWGVIGGVVAAGVVAGVAAQLTVVGTPPADARDLKWSTK